RVGQCLPDSPGEIGQCINTGKFEVLATAGDQKEPVAAPSNIADNMAVPGHVDRDVRRVAVAWHVFQCDPVRAVIFEGHNSDRSVETMSSTPDSAQMPQCDGDADRAVPAHV